MWVILVLIFIETVEIPARAASPESQEYKTIYSAQEITDINCLREMAMMQSASLVTADTIEGTDNFTYTQLLEIREYDDGTLQQSYATRSYEQSISRGKDSYSMFFTFYYTAKADSVSLTTGYTFRPDKLVTTITKYNAPTVTINSLKHDYFIPLENISNSQSYSYTNSSSVGSSQTFTMYPIHRDFYKAANTEFWHASSSMLAQTTVYFSDGQYVSMQRLAYVPQS